jgi:hypothetical protein
MIWLQGSGSSSGNRDLEAFYESAVKIVKTGIGKPPQTLLQAPAAPDEVGGERQGGDAVGFRRSKP